ncbi:hypothetical protein [Thalassomonas haliotis]|uniref:Lipoprotein n=1 Tax=Thalassomonas haliotis TaxID=485448 RepID=A0ABY7VHN5_9GAMM|nr:hypothetical protein [Thalassomonas haliotis]WDE12978.1 hypothetical protein H3N35_05845 [Thalassomonas haliotis]
MKKNIFTLLFLSTALLSCSLTGNAGTKHSPGEQQVVIQGEKDNSKPQRKTPTKQETIYGMNYQANTLSIQLMSNGCTTTKYFKQVWYNSQLKLERIKEDFCRRRPHKKWLDFELPQAFSSVTVINKLAP